MERDLAAIRQNSLSCWDGKIEGDKWRTKRVAVDFKLPNACR